MGSKAKGYVNDEGRECSSCKEYKTWKHYSLLKRGIKGYSSYCKACAKKLRCLKKERANDLRRNYGITLEIYEEMLEDQHYGCKICGKDKEKNGKNLAVDHCHTTGKVRGLLCDKCNRGLGFFEEDKDKMRLAMQYLDES